MDSEDSINNSTDICLSCFKSNVTVCCIKDTHLQNVFEELSLHKIQSDRHPLCYICFKRLLQCEQLMKQIQDLKTECNQSQEKPLVRLSAKNDYVDIPPEDLYKFYVPIVKQECVVDQRVTEICPVGLNDNTAKVDIVGDPATSLNQYEQVPIEIKEENVKIAVDQVENATSEAAFADIARGICTVCNKTFHKKSDLLRHVISHMKEKPFPCDQCNKRFGRKTVLEEHKKTHSRLQPFSCDQCGNKFKTKNNLDVHKKLHIPELYLICELCNKRFTRKCKFEEHKRIHTGLRPFTCDVCSKTFMTNTHLKLHQRTHQKIVKKLHTCDECGKKLTSKSNLNAHKLIHTGDKHYSCGVCDKKFTVKCSLERHKRIHSGDKPYSCDVCSEKFNDSGNLKKHKRIHSGDKPYSCDVCNKRFITSSNLKSHRKRHTGDREYMPLYFAT